VGAPSLHPFNRDFRWIDLEGPTRIITADQLDQFNTDGYVVLRDVLPTEVVAAVEAAIDSIEATTEEFLATQPDGTMFIATAGEITFTVHIAERDATAAAFVAHPVMHDIAADLIGGPFELYWDQAVYKKPEPDRVFPWHQDNGYTFVEPQQYLTLWVPLTPATRHNGCPQVAAGLHRLGTLEHRVEPWGLCCLDHVDDPHVAEAMPGDIVAFSSLTPHLTGPNSTDQVRKAYIVQYAHAGATVVRSGTT
jgi:ectoine hydroxylase-related dioxygenase (phytanoyl-CoA dioxygenase family)